MYTALCPISYLHIVIWNHFFFVSLRKNFAFKLALMIAITDLILAISNLMGAPNPGTMCYVQAFLQEIGDISGILWVCTVSWTIHKITTLDRTPTKMEQQKLFCRMHVVIWTLTVVITLLPLTTSSYGVAGGWCWIKGHKDVDTMWRYLCFYGWLWMAVVYMIVIYIKVF